MIAAEDVISDMENEVEAVGIQLHAWGYTMTIRDMIADENGCGVVRFSLDNPDGLHLAMQYGSTNELSLMDRTTATWAVCTWSAQTA